jgi:hypothetical protein
MQFTDGKPSSMKAKVTTTFAGGAFEAPLLPNQLSQSRVAKNQSEPQTWEYIYELSHFDYDSQDAWYAIETAIPNGSPVKVQGVPACPFAVGTIELIVGGTPATVTTALDWELYWKDGRLSMWR